MRAMVHNVLDVGTVMAYPAYIHPMRLSTGRLVAFLVACCIAFSAVQGEMINRM